MRNNDVYILLAYSYNLPLTYFLSCASICVYSARKLQVPFFQSQESLKMAPRNSRGKAKGEKKKKEEKGNKILNLINYC